MVVSKVGVYKLLKKFEETGSISRRPESSRQTKITPAILPIVEECMRRDDKTTAIQLQHILVDSGHLFSLKMTLWSRTKLGWKLFVMPTR